MASNKLLRVSRAGQAQAFVLVNVISTGREDLDLKLVATEGESPYVLTVRHKTIDKLDGRKSNIPKDKWARILKFALLNGSEDSSDDDFRKGFEMVADVVDEHLKLIFRQRVGELSQGFGSISLVHDEDQEIDLINWAGDAVAKSTSLEREISSLEAKYKSAKASIERLNAQLEELTIAKEKHEEETLAKCVLLLNEKKRRIRDQQRILISAKVDPAKVRQLEDSKTSRRSPNLSRTSKRKAAAEPEDSDSDGFEEMQVDGRVSKTRSDSEGANDKTPERSDTETIGDEEEDTQSDAEPIWNATRSHDLSTSKVKEAHDSSPPPPRGLPFSNKASNAGADAETEGGETEDDEL